MQKVSYSNPLDSFWIVAEEALWLVTFHLSVLDWGSS